MTRETPAQDLVKGNITTLESKLASLSALKESRFATAENTKPLKDSQDQAKQRLRALISNAEKQHKRRVLQKKLVSELASLSTPNASKLRKFIHSTSGRRPLEDTSLHKKQHFRKNAQRKYHIFLIFRN